MRTIFLLLSLVSWKAQAAPQGVKIETPANDDSPLISQPQNSDQNIGLEDNAIENPLPSQSQTLPDIQTQNNQIILPVQTPAAAQAQKTKTAPQASPSQNTSSTPPVQSQEKNKRLPIGIPPGGPAWTREKSNLGSLQDLNQNANPAGVATLQRQLREIFDREIAGHESRHKSQSPKVEGKTENAFDRVYQAASVADSASAIDSPVLFEASLSVVQKAAKKGELSPLTASFLNRTLRQAAAKKAKQALPQLLKETAQAALEREDSVFKRAMKAFESWNDLLGTRKKPLISNWPQTFDYLQNLNYSALKEPLSSVSFASRLRIEKTPSGQFKAILPPFPLNLSIQLLPQPTNSEKNLALIFGAQEIFSPALDLSWKAFYDIERRLGKQSPLASAWAAARYSAQIESRRLWDWFWETLAMFRKPQSVNLGNEVTFKTHNRNFQKIASLALAPPRNFKSSFPVAFLNLSSINHPYFDFKRRPTLSSAENLAQAYQNLSGDFSGAQGLSDLTQTLKAAPASLADSKILGYWTERIYSSSIAFLFEALKRSARSLKKPVFFVDRGSAGSPGTVLLVLRNSGTNSVFKLLKEARFDALSQSGWIYALKYPGHPQIQSTVSLAEDIVSGKIKSLPQNSALILSPIAEREMSQAVRAYQGLKDSQALIHWWNQFANRPNADAIGIALSQKLWALKNHSGITPQSLFPIFKAIKQSFPRTAQKRKFSADIHALTRRNI